MKRYWQLCLVIAFVSFLLYRYIDAQNGLLTLQRTLPQLAQEVRELQEENLRLAYAAAKAQSPQRLWELSHRPEYGHLHFVPRTAIDKLPQVAADSSAE